MRELEPTLEPIRKSLTNGEERMLFEFLVELEKDHVEIGLEQAYGFWKGQREDIEFMIKSLVNKGLICNSDPHEQGAGIKYMLTSIGIAVSLSSAAHVVGEQLSALEDRVEKDPRRAIRIREKLNGLPTAWEIRR